MDDKPSVIAENLFEQSFHGFSLRIDKQTIIILISWMKASFYMFEENPIKMRKLYKFYFN